MARAGRPRARARARVVRGEGSKGSKGKGDKGGKGGKGSKHAERIILSVPPAESMMLSELFDHVITYAMVTNMLNSQGFVPIYF
jgi:hypothetical protein